MMFCFDENYVIPAAVAFYSLLENNEKEAIKQGIKFKLYVVHNNISTKSQNKLQKTIQPFSHFAQLEFIDGKNQLAQAWERIIGKNHFSLEVLYKLLVSSLFSKYEKIIISDVDVVFLGNVIKEFDLFDTNQNYLIGGVVSNDPNSFFPIPKKGYLRGYQKYSYDELRAIQHGVGGGYLIINIKQWIENKIEERALEILFNKAEKLVLAEQDVINLSCFPHIKKIHPAHIVGHYNWQKNGKEFENIIPIVYTREEIKEMCNFPIQLHYVGANKPWNTPSEPKSEIWFQYLCKTPFLRDFLNTFEQKIIEKTSKQHLWSKLKRIIKNPKILWSKIFG